MSSDCEHPPSAAVSTAARALQQRTRASLAHALEQLRCPDARLFESDLALLSAPLRALLCAADPLLLRRGALLAQSLPLGALSGCAPLLRPLLASDALCCRALRLLSHSASACDVSALRSDIACASQRSAIAARESLAMLFSVWRRSGGDRSELAAAARTALYGSETRLIGAQVLWEIGEPLRARESALLLSVIGAGADAHTVTKVTALIARCGDDAAVEALCARAGEIAVSAVGCCALLPLVERARGNAALRSCVAECLRRHVEAESDAGVREYLALRLMELGEEADCAKSVGAEGITAEWVERVFSEKRYFEAQVLMEREFERNDWFFNLIFNVYNVRTAYAVHVAEQLVRKLRGESEKRAFLKYVRTRLRGMRNDKFCHAVASIIAEVSDVYDDLMLLIPEDLSTYPKEVQSFLLSSGTMFWLRTKFKIENGMMNRLCALMYSNHREIRIKAYQFVELVKIN